MWGMGLRDSEVRGWGSKVEGLALRGLWVVALRFMVKCLGPCLNLRGSWVVISEATSALQLKYPVAYRRCASAEV